MESFTRRERRIAARKQQIMEAAAKLFAEKGFHRTTTHDIANAADVSEGTLYNYFENKDELLIGIMGMLGEIPAMSAGLDQVTSVDGRDLLLEMMRQRRSYLDRYGAMLQSVLSEILVDPVLRQRYYQELVVPGIEALSERLQSAQEQGAMRDFSVPHIVRVLIALYLGLYVMEVLGDPLIRPQWEQLSQSVASLLYKGAAPQKD